MAPVLMVNFVGGDVGEWSVASLSAIVGESLPAVSRLQVREGVEVQGSTGNWVLRGVTSHERYVARSEHEQLSERQPPLGRPAATCAALIPIRKSAAWWELAQDERRAIFEDRSRHIRVGLEYLPAVARRLHHCRDFGEPFDFLTWFEFGPPDAEAFEELVGRLRETDEWAFVEREVDIRLAR